jgi:hypothetical protein
MLQKISWMILLRYMEKFTQTQPDQTPPPPFEISAPDGQIENGNETVTETFYFFRELLAQQGFTEYTDVNSAYKSLPPEKIMVRREDPRNVLKLLSEEGSYEVDFVGNDRYSNCVEWNPATDGPRNISNAYLEGYTNLNSVVTLIGMERNDTDDIMRLPDAVQNFHGLQRDGVRSFTGTVNKDRVLFINLRVPGHLIPESELTDDELERLDLYHEAKEAGSKSVPVMIHRSYLQNNLQTDDELEKAA